MPTVKANIDGHFIRVYVRDEHRPPHVHVETADWEIRVRIGQVAKFWTVAYGHPSSKEIRRAEALVQTYLAECNTVWRQYHGEL